MDEVDKKIVKILKNVNQDSQYIIETKIDKVKE